MTATKVDLGKLLTIPQAAEWMDCSRQHVYNLIHAGELEYVDIAKRKAGKTKMRVPESALGGFAASRTQRVPHSRTRASLPAGRKASAA